MTALTRWRVTEDENVRWRLEFKIEDFWIGAFWRFREEGAGLRKSADLYVCLLPCLPLHFEITIDREQEAVSA